jgi:membrane-associated phospholipid phosphatase
VWICYYFVDRPVAFFVHDNQLNRVELLRWITYLPMALNVLAPAMITTVIVSLAWRVPGRLERTLFIASVSLMVVLAFEYYLKFLFGRYWPGTWIDNNPSLLRDNSYGFHLFHFGAAFGSFPSGHTARVVAFLSVVWTAYPRWKWLGFAACALVMFSLVGMNYHFVGDTIAGACLGGLTGMYAARLSRLASPDESSLQ